MTRPLKPPPDGWDPKTVVGVSERLQISGFGIKKPLNFQDQITQHKWKYAAGDTGGKTKEQAAIAHRYARVRVWDIVMSDRARAIHEDNRTEEQTADIQKVDYPFAYKKSRKGNSRVTPIIPPPAKWRPELVGEARTGEAWKYAAGSNDDGSTNTKKSHSHARMAIIRDARVDEANDKDSCDRTP